MILKIGPAPGFVLARYSIAVRDLDEASRAYQAARDASGEGQSTFPSGFVYDDKQAIVARISYNGRVWAPSTDVLIQEAAT